MWITRVSLNNPVFATMPMIGITVLGIFSYARLRVEQMPDVTLPFVIIKTAYPGASPEAVEIDVTRPIENAVNGVSGVKLVRSVTGPQSRESRLVPGAFFGRPGCDFEKWYAPEETALVRLNVGLEGRPEALQALHDAIGAAIEAAWGAGARHDFDDRAAPFGKPDVGED